MNRCVPLLAALLAMAILTGCATAPLREMSPGATPAEDTDEGGLWDALEESERALQKSPLLVRDPELNAYVRSLVCRYAGDYCKDIRVYIVRRPYFNASMAPNGMMQVWTGALLRAENEAQLGFVLGHEIGHFLGQHSIKQWRRTKNTANALSLLQLIAARSPSASAGDAFDVALLAAYATLFKYSRDHEREADMHGFDRSVALGYNPNQGWKLWQALLAEENARDRRKPSSIFATHPATEERLTTLRQEAETLGAHGEDLGMEPYRAAMQPFLTTWLADEVQRRNYPQTLVLLDRLATREGFPNPGLLAYFRGEVFRKRRAPGDDKRAIDAYLEALDLPGHPTVTLRDLGYAYRRILDQAAANQAFADYLQTRPEAEDRALIEHLMKEPVRALED